MFLGREQEGTSCYLEKLLIANKRGIIPGEKTEASDESYWQRTQWPVKRILPICESYDIAIDWIEVGGGNLCPWEGGATVVQSESDIKLLLREGLSKEMEKEILLHESIHLARSVFSSSIYEEIWAYELARNGMQRWAGPLWDSTIEVLVSGVSLGLIAFAGIVPAVVVWGWLVARLLWRKGVLAKAKVSLAKVAGESWAAAMMRMTDREIAEVGKMSLEEVISYARDRLHLLRWQIIFWEYFKRGDK